MCLDLSCGHTKGGSSSSGIGLAIVTVVWAAMVALAYQVMLVAWPVLLAAYLLTVLLYFKPTRKVTWAAMKLGLAGVLWLARASWRRYRKPSTEVVATDLAYQATLFVEGKPGENHQIIGRGTVYGPWATVEQAQQAIRDRWIAEAGLPADGPLVCHAVPVTS